MCIELGRNTVKDELTYCDSYYSTRREQEYKTYLTPKILVQWKEQVAKPYGYSYQVRKGKHNHLKGEHNQHYNYGNTPMQICWCNL